MDDVIRQLRCETQELRVQLKGVHEELDHYRLDMEKAVAAECGCVILSNAACYQDFVSILINNNYAVEVQPIELGKKLKITIKKGE